MLEPPKHKGPFRRSAILEVATGILRRPPQPEYAAKCVYLQPGKLTVLFGPSNNERSRFAIGLISGLLESDRHIEAKPVFWFNRRALYLEILKMLLQHESSRSLERCGGDHQEAMLQAIQHIEQSGLEYDSTCESAEAICTKVRARQNSKPVGLIVVDGLEHFHGGQNEAAPATHLLQQLILLRQLAQETASPILVTCPQLPSSEKEAVSSWADLEITLTESPVQRPGE